MNYTTYLFDFDYTLADSSRGIVICFRKVLTRHGYTDVTDDEIKRTIGKSLEASFSLLTGVTDADRLAGFKDEYRKEADTHMTANTVLFPETKSVLTALKESGARIGIISTKYRFRIKELLDQHFPADFMDIIVGGEDVEAAKPSPEGVLFAIGQLHADKAETLYTGDSTVDAETAQAAGVDFAGVTHGVTTAEELEQYPHLKIMSTLEELPTVREEKPTAREENSSLPEAEKPVPPENIHTTSPRKKQKWISVWQILLLLLLCKLAVEEPANANDSNLFLTLFLLALWGILRKRKILPDKAKACLRSWVHPYAVRLRALHIKLIRRRETPPIDNETCTCLNCGTTYTGNYCNRCGQSRHTSRYRINNILKNIAGGFFNIDKGFGRTLLELLYRPGYMIGEFIGGKRVEYFRPFQTLFILAALYLMTVQLVDPQALNRRELTPQEKQEQNREELIATRNKLQKKLEKSSSQEKKEQLAITIKSIDEALEEDRPVSDSLSASLLTRDGEKGEEMPGRLLQGVSKAEESVRQFIRQSPFLLNVWNLLKSWGHGNKAFRIIATLPLFAIATQLAFRHRKSPSNYNTTEHLFIQAYLACQILLLSIIVLPFNGHAKVDNLYELPLWLIFVLFCLDYKQLYRCTWWRSFWRTILMLFYCFVMLLLFACLVMALMLGGIYAMGLTV